MPRLCVECKGTKLLCGRPKCPILERAKAMQVIGKVTNNIQGESPPSVFVGRFGYPKVSVGPLISTVSQSGNAEVLDSPEAWFGKPLEEIIHMRSQLIRGKLGMRVDSARDPSRNLQEMQISVMSKGSVGMEAKFKKIHLEPSWNDTTMPHGPSGELVDLDLSWNPKIPMKVDKIVNDDLNATQGMFSLYNLGLPVSRISQILSIGLLGLDKKLVPTRWSITATDDTLGKALIKQVKTFPELDEYLVFEGEYLANQFEILLVPGKWMFENLEIWSPGCLWVTKGENPIIISDWEPYKGRTSYASNVEGAYYAARLGVLEYLTRIGRQATAWVVREVKPGYWAPVGVWQIRENVRHAMQGIPKHFPDLDQALAFIRERVSTRGWEKKSQILPLLRSRNLLAKWIQGEL